MTGTMLLLHAIYLVGSMHYLTLRDGQKWRHVIIHADPGSIRAFSIDR